MKVLKLLWCCWFWTAFVITAKGQIVDTSIYYQLIERNLDVPNSLAQVIIKNQKGQVLVVCKSLSFDIEEGIQIQAQNTKTSLYLYAADGGIDSIAHTKVNFKYDIAKRTLFLAIPEEGNYPKFYANSLQGMEVAAQNIEWRIGEEQLYFDRNQRAICFTSVHHFEASLMEAYQSLGNTNPLVKMGLYVQKKGRLDAWFALNEMALLFDKRLENVVFMDSTEVEKARKNPAFKIITNKQDFEQFRKGYPTIFKFAGIEVENIKALIDKPSIDGKTALPLYLKMLEDGFLDYNKKSQEIQLQDKLFHYVAAMNRRSDYDYDHLKFYSKSTKDTRATLKPYLDLKTQILFVPHVEEIVLGRRQNVVATPFHSIHLLPNLDLKFDGKIRVGNTCFEGTDFQFEYDTYRLVLPQITKLNLGIYKRVRLKNEWSNQTSIGSERALDKEGEATEEVELIQSIIEGGKGYLRIDTTTNKSGKNEKGVKMPFFASNSLLRVYYDKCRLGGKAVYPRKSFYYELNPFQLNKIDELDIEQISFKGKFYSANIFSVFKNDLKLQISDLSLGFDTLIIKEYKTPIYLSENAKGKGAFYGQVQLSNAGLVGNGTLTYLGASLGCDVFNFLPKAVEAKQVDSFVLEASKLFPKVRAKHIKMLWKPYENRMYLNSLFTEGFPFHFYYKNQKYRLDGQLMMSPKGLTGQGTLDWKQASMVSNPEGDYEIGANAIRSASVAVLLKINGLHQFGFEQENVRLELDFKQKIAHFTSQEMNSVATFPYNAYQTTLNHFDWDWKRNLLFIKSSDGQKGIFRKEGMLLEDLYFEASKGIYDLNTGGLTLKKVAPIKIGNAFLSLKDSILEIEGAAYIEKLEGKLLIGAVSKPNYTLSEVDLIWNTKTKSFVSKGTSFELKIGEESSLQLVKGKIEILSTEKGLIVNYAWIFPNGDWCFFRCEHGILSAISSSGSVDGILLEEVERFESFRLRWL